MAKILIPAASVHQGELILYAAALKVADLASENFYNVETLMNRVTPSPAKGMRC